MPYRRYFLYALYASGLMLVPGTAHRPRLEFRFTAANVVLPETDWKRPVELDIARWCGE